MTHTVDFERRGMNAHCSRRICKEAQGQGRM